MTQVSEITERGHTSQEVLKQSWVEMLLAVAKLLLKNPKAVKFLMVFSDDEERYVRPPRQYEIPPFRDDMRYCTSNEQYLRPTRYCNPREPEVIAMANELGAFELSDYEFANAAYWFVKTKLANEMLPLDSVSATLKRGTGMCYHLTSVFVALCRAAGIKARYKEFSVMLSDFMTSLAVTERVNLGVTEQEMIMTAFFNRPTVHGEAEACIDGTWVVANVGMGAEIHAQAGVPITKFGEDVGLTFKLIPETTKHFESIPLWRGIREKAWMWLAPVLKERTNIVFNGALLHGRKIIEEAGGIEAYDQNAKRRRGELAAIEEEITRLIKEAQRQQVVEFEE
jgi:hypothetical protein